MEDKNLSGTDITDAVASLKKTHRFSQKLPLSDLTDAYHEKPAIGIIQCDNGIKIIAVSDAVGVLLALYAARLSPPEPTLVKNTLNHIFADVLSHHPNGEKAYDSDTCCSQ